MGSWTTCTALRKRLLAETGRVWQWLLTLTGICSWLKESGSCPNQLRTLSISVFWGGIPQCFYHAPKLGMWGKDLCNHCSPKVMSPWKTGAVVSTQSKHRSSEAEEWPFLEQLGVEYTPQRVILFFRTARCDVKLLFLEWQSGRNPLAHQKFSLALLDLGPDYSQSNCRYWSIFPQWWLLKC